MLWRELDYLSRLVQAYRDLEYSVVFYVGYGAGRCDKGIYQINNPKGGVSLYWQYQVIRLWEMSAEELSVLGKPALLPLIGQTQIKQPDKFLPKVLESLKIVSDDEMQGRLLSELMALMNDEEMVNMLENLIEKDELLMNTPFLRRIRTKSREEGLEKGLEKGHQKGRQEGDLIRYHQNILRILALRFDPPVPSYQHLE